VAIPDQVIEQVQSRIDIVEIISKYVPLKKAGRSYKAPCPFHQEKTPSFIVSQDKQIYHCFGCGAGGNVFSFLMRYENMQFPEVVEMLAEKAGVLLPKDFSRSQENSSLNNQLYSANELACQFFQASLSRNPKAIEYLNSRGIGDDTVKKFRIGYSPDAWEALLSGLIAKGLNAQLLDKAGLVVANDRGGHYDRFRNRITFPIIDLKDKIMGFGARVLDSSLPKYINSPETPIYVKGRQLYGLNFSKEAIRKERFALVVEGYLDFIIPFQAGVQNIIATLGTALTLDQVKLVKRFANTVIIVYDPDAAGESASLRGLDLFLSEDVNVYIAELPKGRDPDGYIREFGAEDFLRLVKAGKNIFEYKLDKLKGRFDASTTHGKAAIVGEMLPTIAKINNAVSRSDLVKKLSERLSVDEDAVKAEMKKVKTDRKLDQPFTVKPLAKRSDSRQAQIMVLALLMDGESAVRKIKALLSNEEFNDPPIRDMVRIVFDMYDKKKEITPLRLINSLGNSDQASALVSEAVGVLDMLVDKDRAMADCIMRIKKDNIKDQLDKLQDAIKAAHSQKDEDTVKKLVTEYNGLVQTKHGAKVT